MQIQNEKINICLIFVPLNLQIFPENSNLNLFKITPPCYLFYPTTQFWGVHTVYTANVTESLLSVLQ